MAARAHQFHALLPPRRWTLKVSARLEVSSSTGYDYDPLDPVRSIGGNVSSATEIMQQGAWDQIGGPAYLESHRGGSAFRATRRDCLRDSAAYRRYRGHRSYRCKTVGLIIRARYR